MHHRPQVAMAPTLALMAQIYSLSRQGGNRSARFAAYLGDVEHNWGLAAYNPMAGDAASAAVNALLALDAENVALTAATQVLDQCEWSEPLTLAVVIATPGMWTDRLATEVRHRTAADRRPAHGEILLWATEPQDIATIQKEAAAEAIRTAWTSLHGPTLTLHAVLAREGLAYAMGRTPAARETSATPAVDTRVEDAIGILGDTATLGDIVAIMYGDEAAASLGYTPLGIAPGAGYAVAIARATELVSRAGQVQARRSGPAALLRQE